MSLPAFVQREGADVYKVLDASDQGWGLAVLRTKEPTCWMDTRNWAEFSDTALGRRTLVEGGEGGVLVDWAKWRNRREIRDWADEASWEEEGAA